MLVLKNYELVEELPSVTREFLGLTTQTKKNQKCDKRFSYFRVRIMMMILMWLHIKSCVGITIHRIALYNTTLVEWSYYSPESQGY